MIQCRKYYLSILICITISIINAANCYAQQELNLHFMEQVIQSNATNPALFTDDKLVIAAPGLTYNYGNNAFTYHDLLKKRNGQNILDVSTVLQKLHRKNVLQNQLNIDIIRVQLKTRNLYFTFLASEKMNIKFSYSKDLVDLLWNGNAARIGDTLSIGPSLNGRYYRELGFGIGKRSNKWTVGARAKLLIGLADIYTEKEKIIVYTDPEAYQTTITTDFLLNTSGEERFLDKPLSGAMSLKNRGASIDMGAVYKPNTSWSFSASLNNLGFIKWRKNTTNYHSQASYSYEGLHLNKYFEMDTFKTKNLIDTLKSTFNPKITATSYTSYQIPRVYLSGRYQINSHYTTGILFYTEGFETLSPAINTYLQRRFGKSIHVGLSYAMKNRLFNNFGMSASYRQRKLQAFAVTDNFPAILKVKDSKNVNFRMGINIIWK